MNQSLQKGQDRGFVVAAAAFVKLGNKTWGCFFFIGTIYIVTKLMLQYSYKISVYIKSHFKSSVQSLHNEHGMGTPVASINERIHMSLQLAQLVSAWW